MGITVTLRGGSGDMLMAVYDPDLDSVIALAQTEAKLKTIIGVASDALQKSEDAVISINNLTPYAKKETIVIPPEYATSEFRVKFKLTAPTATAKIVYGKIYKNGVAHGTQRSKAQGTGSETFTEDLAFTGTDNIELYCYTNAVNNFGSMSEFRVYGYFTRIGDITW